MISVFDTNPVTFEDKGRTLTISYNGVLCKNANGQIITDIDFEDVNELFLTRYLNSNSNYTIRFRDHNWKSIEGQDLDTDRKGLMLVTISAKQKQSLLPLLAIN